MQEQSEKKKAKNGQKLKQMTLFTRSALKSEEGSEDQNTAEKTTQKRAWHQERKPGAEKSAQKSGWDQE